MTPWTSPRSDLVIVLILLFPLVAPGQWVAFNDHAPGSGTHSNATHYHTFAELSPASGFLRDINSGTNLPAYLALTRTSSGVTPNASSAAPAGGTPLSQTFDGFVDFNGSPDPSIEVAGAGVVTYTFTNLNRSKLYRFHGSAIRGAVDYTNRWALCEITGTTNYTPAHSSHVLTTATVAALSRAQAALNSGVNFTAATGDYVSWDNIQPGTNGSFAITCRQYTGTVPGGNSAGLKGYALNGLRLEEFSTNDSPVAIVTQPANQFVFEGQTAVLTANASGSPLFYQWLREDEPISGATNRVFSIPCANRTNSGRYSFIVSNSLGSVTSSYAGLTVIVAQVIAWGRNDFGEVNVPFNLSNVVMLAAGSWHGLALQGDGTVRGWGRNDFGQINIPAAVTNPVAIAAGFYFSMALMLDRTVRCWGDNTWGQLNIPPSATNIVMIAPGYDHALALKGDGTVVAWGRNDSGQSTVPLGLSNVVSIRGGGPYSLALKADGTVRAWGNYDRAGPVIVPDHLSNVVGLAAANLHTLALKANGTVVAWGDNSVGQTNVPAGLSNVVAIAAGNGFSGSHSLALKADGSITPWGYNNFNQSTLPPCLPQATAIAAAEYDSFVINAEDATAAGPVIMADPFVMGVVGRPIYHRFAVRNGPAAFRAAGLTSELVLEPTTGLLTGWPVSAGTFPVTVTASNVSGMAERSITLIVQPNGDAPVIAESPHSRVALVGDLVIFKSVITGTSPLNLQWYFDDLLLAGQTNSTLFLNSVQLTNAGAYRVFVDSAGGSAWSDFATLTVLEQPRLLTSGAWWDASNQTIRLSLPALNGYRNIIIDASTDLVTWEAVWTNDTPAIPFEITNTVGTNELMRFFRARGESP